MFNPNKNSFISLPPRPIIDLEPKEVNVSSVFPQRSNAVRQLVTTLGIFPELLDLPVTKLQFLFIITLKT
jgi:hypothetical protein